MLKRRGLPHLCLVLLFLLMQGLVLVHGVEHGFEPEHQDPACHLCVAGHGLGTLMAGPGFRLILPLADPVQVARPALLPAVLALPRPRQRGPPLSA